MAMPLQAYFDAFHLIIHFKTEQRKKRNGLTAPNRMDCVQKMSRNVFETGNVLSVWQLEEFFETLWLMMFAFVVVVLPIWLSSLSRRRAILLLAYFSAFMR